MSKYYTDKEVLFEILKENDENVKVKVVDVIEGVDKTKIGYIVILRKEPFYKYFIPYDLEKPLMIKINKGKRYCEYCGRELQFGDWCIKYDGMVFCDEHCFELYLNYEEGTIENEDLGDEEFEEIPMFNYKEQK